jgi:hypothetical protein
MASFSAHGDSRFPMTAISTISPIRVDPRKSAVRLFWISLGTREVRVLNRIYRGTPAVALRREPESQDGFIWLNRSARTKKTGTKPALT